MNQKFKIIGEEVLILVEKIKLPANFLELVSEYVQLEKVGSN